MADKYDLARQKGGLNTRSPKSKVVHIHQGYPVGYCGEMTLCHLIVGDGWLYHFHESKGLRRCKKCMEIYLNRVKLEETENEDRFYGYERGHD